MHFQGTCQKMKIADTCHPTNIDLAGHGYDVRDVTVSRDNNRQAFACHERIQSLCIIGSYAGSQQP